MQQEDVDRAIAWLPLPDVAEVLGVQLRAVRGMVADRALVAVRRGERSVWSVPAGFLVLEPAGGSADVPGVVSGLRGTLTQLGDAGLDDEEIVRWLHTPHEELGSTPLEALRALRTHAVRRAAQPLAF